MSLAGGSFAMLSEADGTVVLTRLDGTETCLQGWADLEEVLSELPGTPEALELGIESASLTVFHLGDLYVVLNARAVAGSALPASDAVEEGWDSALVFVGDSPLPPIVLEGLTPESTRQRAEDRAYEYLNEAILLSARGRLPAAGLFAPVTGLLDRIRMANWLRRE